MPDSKSTKVPVYIYFRIEGAARDEFGQPAPAYASLLIGHTAKDNVPPYSQLISKVTIHDVMTLIPMLNAMYDEAQISFCTPEEYHEGTGE